MFFCWIIPVNGDMVQFISIAYILGYIALLFLQYLHSHSQIWATSYPGSMISKAQLGQCRCHQVSTAHFQLPLPLPEVKTECCRYFDFRFVRRLSSFSTYCCICENFSALENNSDPLFWETAFCIMYKSKMEY